MVPIDDLVRVVTRNSRDTAQGTRLSALASLAADERGPANARVAYARARSDRGVPDNGSTCRSTSGAVRRRAGGDPRRATHADGRKSPDRGSRRNRIHPGNEHGIMHRMRGAHPTHLPPYRLLPGSQPCPQPSSAGPASPCPRTSPPHLLLGSPPSPPCSLLCSWPAVRACADTCVHGHSGTPHVTAMGRQCTTW